MARRQRRDYYEVLGVPRNADERAIKAAYRRLARTYHPDVTGDDAELTERFKEITEAYETLSDARRRRTYDLFGRDDALSKGGFDLDDAVQSIRDLFRRGDAQAPRPGVDMETDVKITLAEAYTGAKKPVTVVLDRPCATCAGAGRKDERTCPTCRGLGTRLQEETLVVTIPKGATDGMRLRLKGRGAAGEHRGPPGDLYAVLRVEVDRSYDRDDDTLYTDVRVPMSTVLVGGAFEVPLPDGSTVKMAIPPGTQGGQVFRLRGKGFPVVGSGARGDLLVTVQLSVPRDLSDDARALVERLVEKAPGF